MSVILVEFLLGLYFVGVSISVSKQAGAFTYTIDWFKLCYGILLFVLSFIGLSLVR